MVVPSSSSASPARASNENKAASDGKKRKRTPEELPKALLLHLPRLMPQATTVFLLLLPKHMPNSLPIQASVIPAASRVPLQQLTFSSLNSNSNGATVRALPTHARGYRRQSCERNHWSVVAVVAACQDET